MKLEMLDEPFPSADIEWRIQQSGKTGNGTLWAMVLAYVTNRAIMKRLDDVCGKAGWRNEYRDIPNNGGVECGISIKVDGEWITKWDAAENTQVEAVKGGRSGAMKRAAVQWGIGRYLYNLEEEFAQVSADKKQGWNRASLKDKSPFWWSPPALPAWALPSAGGLSSIPDPVIASTPVPEFKGSPDDVVKLFSNEANKAETEGKLSDMYKAAWAAVGGSKEHEKQIIDIFKHRKSDFKQAA